MYGPENAPTESPVSGKRPADSPLRRDLKPPGPRHHAPAEAQRLPPAQLEGTAVQGAVADDEVGEMPLLTAELNVNSVFSAE